MAIIVCPKCAKKHKVNIEHLKSTAPSGKTIAARCKSCNYKFPVKIDMLIKDADPIGKPVEADKTEPEPSVSSARKICVTLSKGGVGKTTTSVNLSAGLALAGFRQLALVFFQQRHTSLRHGQPQSGHANQGLLEFRLSLW